MQALSHPGYLCQAAQARLYFFKITPRYLFHKDEYSKNKKRHIHKRVSHQPHNLRRTSNRERHARFDGSELKGFSKFLHRHIFTDKTRCP